MADLLIHNARIFDGHQLISADAVAVSGGSVVAHGTGSDLLEAAGPHAELIDAEGGLLTPGFTDAHVHAVAGGVERLGCDLSDAGNATECRDAISSYAARTEASDGWISGGGWTMSDFPGGTPTAVELDELIPDRGAFLVNRDHHSAWVNSHALELAGITADAPDPPGGRIERDDSGNPTGTLHEGAMDLVSCLIPEETQEQLRHGLLEGQRYLNTFGITGWQDAIIGQYSGHADPYAAYCAADAAGELHSDVVGALWWPREVQDIPEQVRIFRERRRHASSGTRFRATAVKFMLDGVVESRTAAMAEPYHSCGCPGAGSGLSYFEADFLAAAFTAIDAAGFDIHLHAIGDRAVSQGLDAFAAMRGANPGRDGRHHIAHVQVVDPRDVPRFAELDVTANLQALWACNDDSMRDLTVPVLGEERAGWQYPFRSLLDAGARLAMGSDWSVSTPDPWQAIHTAVNRTEGGAEEPREPLNPGEAIGLLDALRAYTSGSARLNRSAAGGRIEIGGPADLALADCDPFAVPESDLHRVSNRLTVVAGAIVHDARNRTEGEA